MTGWQYREGYGGDNKSGLLMDYRGIENVYSKIST